MESTSEDPETRREYDIESISGIFDKHVHVSATITKAIRLGKKGDKPRLLKISLASDFENSSVIRNCIKLRNTDLLSVIQKVFITPDLTPKEQAANKKLHAELKELNKDGKKFKIKKLENSAEEPLTGSFCTDNSTPTAKLSNHSGTLTVAVIHCQSILQNI